MKAKSEVSFDNNVVSITAGSAISHYFELANHATLKRLVNQYELYLTRIPRLRSAAHGSSCSGTCTKMMLVLEKTFGAITVCRRYIYHTYASFSLRITVATSQLTRVYSQGGPSCAHHVLAMMGLALRKLEHKPNPDTCHLHGKTAWFSRESANRARASPACYCCTSRLDFASTPTAWTKTTQLRSGVYQHFNWNA